jgi:predicted dehydrogenase/aryl-alcohol dehydrogenase-like predicted oxidoreductase
MSTKLRWGIIGTGNIAKAFAKGLARSRTGELLAVGSRSQSTADRFADEFKVPRRYASYEALLADRDVQAVYISTPHPLHAQWAIAAADAGKHVLCEKPIGLNHAEAMAIVEAAVRNDVFLMEAFMYRCHPQTARLVDLLREKTIGEVRVIQATFSFHAGFNAEGRLFKNALAGGGILDVGGYCTSMARLVAGAALGKDFAEPTEVKGAGRLGVTGVDEWAVAVLKFPGDILATLSTGISVGQENVVRIFGSEGHIVLPSPWIPSREGGTTKILLKKNNEREPREIVVETPEYLYGIEADTVARYVDQRQAAPPAMTCDDSLGNMKTLDLWRDAIGLVYESERPEALVHTVSRCPLAPRPGHRMKFGHVPGVDLPISRLVMGVDNQRTITHGSVMFDDFIERGGNAFDTAYVYAGGQCEKVLGQWVKTRGIRKDVVIIGKGAHTPNCNPQDLTKQLLISLERLQTDYLDLYFMHRDNLEAPVGEFVDVLNEHLKAGRVRAFGGSNWTLDRVEAANEYAKSKGLTGFAAVSNNLSLARMIEPPWAGCLSASDAASRAWLARRQMPLFSWSSQARGFFIEGKADPNDRSDKELVRCWYSEDNFRRLERAKELARRRGVRPINVALAYVLCQPFPTFALIGPRTLAETRTSMPALDLTLTPDEVKWLNLEA